MRLDVLKQRWSYHSIDTMFPGIRISALLSLTHFNKIPTQKQSDKVLNVLPLCLRSVFFSTGHTKCYKFTQQIFLPNSVVGTAKNGISQH